MPGDYLILSAGESNRRARGACGQPCGRGGHESAGWADHTHRTSRPGRPGGGVGGGQPPPSAPTGEGDAGWGRVTHRDAPGG